MKREKVREVDREKEREREDDKSTLIDQESLRSRQIDFRF